MACSVVHTCSVPYLYRTLRVVAWLPLLPDTPHLSTLRQRASSACVWTHTHTRAQTHLSWLMPAVTQQHAVVQCRARLRVFALVCVCECVCVHVPSEYVSASRRQRGEYQLSCVHVCGLELLTHLCTHTHTHTRMRQHLHFPYVLMCSFALHTHTHTYLELPSIRQRHMHAGTCMALPVIHAHNSYHTRAQLDTWMFAVLCISILTCICFFVYVVSSFFRICAWLI